jgi:hypothetical protein
MQNDLNAIEAFFNRSDIKDKSALYKLHLWLEERGAVTLKWYAKPNAKELTEPAIEYVRSGEKYMHNLEVHNKWQAELLRRDKVKI